jgi:hypothetical protein
MLVNEDVVMFMEALSEPQRLSRDRNLSGAIVRNGDQHAADDDAVDYQPSPVVSGAPNVGDRMAEGVHGL